MIKFRLWTKFQKLLEEYSDLAFVKLKPASFNKEISIFMKMIDITLLNTLDNSQLSRLLILFFRNLIKLCQRDLRLQSLWKTINNSKEKKLKELKKNGKTNKNSGKNQIHCSWTNKIGMSLFREEMRFW